MHKKQFKNIISKLRMLLKEKGISVGKIVLFGSYAKNNTDKDSDVDIAIISKDFEGKGIFERAKMLGDLEWKLMDKYLLPFDIVTISADEFKKGVTLVSQFAKEGNVYYSNSH